MYIEMLAHGGSYFYFQMESKHNKKQVVVIKYPHLSESV